MVGGKLSRFQGPKGHKETRNAVCPQAFKWSKFRMAFKALRARGLRAGSDLACANEDQNEGHVLPFSKQDEADGRVEQTRRLNAL